MSRRDEIRLSDAETAAFLAAERVVVCASLGRDGWPHLMPLWYVLRGAELWAWTYAKSQKARNLERDPRCTLVVEAGDGYAELRGVMIKADCELVRDVEAVAALGTEIAARYGGELTDEVVRRQAPKRVGLRFVAWETVTWDHRKLGGGY